MAVGAASASGGDCAAHCSRTELRTDGDGFTVRTRQRGQSGRNEEHTRACEVSHGDKREPDDLTHVLRPAKAESCHCSEAELTKRV